MDNHKKLLKCLDYFVQQGIFTLEEKKDILNIISKKRVLINNEPIDEIGESECLKHDNK